MPHYARQDHHLSIDTLDHVSASSTCSSLSLGVCVQDRTATAYTFGPASQVVGDLLQRGILCGVERAARGCWVSASGWGGKGSIAAPCNTTDSSQPLGPCPRAFPGANAKSDFTHTTEKPVASSSLFSLKQLAVAGVGITQRKGHERLTPLTH